MPTNIKPQNHGESKHPKLPQIPRSKSLVIQHSPKKKEWDDRFILNQMPESPSKSKQTESYRKILMNNNIETPNKNQKPKPQKSNSRRKENLMTMKLQLIQFLQKKHDEYQADLLNTVKMMKQAELPDYFQFYTLKNLQNTTDVKEYLLHLHKSIKDKDTFYHKISGAYQSRKRFISEVEFFVKNLKSEQILQRKQQYERAIKSLRLLTASVIQNIQKWRNSMNYNDERPVFFTDQSCKQNVLTSLLNDTSFILLSNVADYVNMGTKNDPFFLSGIKKSKGKQSSPYLQIFMLSKPYQQYHKYMEYLASQKAYQLSLLSNKKPVRQVHGVEKIYMNKQKSLIKQNPFEEHMSEPQMLKASKVQYKSIERRKARLQRIHKSQQRINIIKRVYDREPKKHKKVGSDIGLSQIKIQEELFNLEPSPSKHRKPKKLKQKFQEDQFDRMVNEQTTHKARPKIDYNDYNHNQKMKEQKMIDNVREFEQKLKLKLKQMRMDDHEVEVPGRKGYQMKNKSQNQIVNELKGQIIAKIEESNRQKQLSKLKRKEEEERMIEEIRIKMKNQLNEQLEKKKKEKIMEREQLEKKLQHEQERFKKQKQLEIQFQVKLAKEKQLRQIETMKREALEREQKLKQELERETQLRKERQEAIQKEKKEKQELLNKLKLKELEKEVEDQVRETIVEKQPREKLQKSEQPDQQLIREEGKDNTLLDKVQDNGNLPANMLHNDSDQVQALEKQQKEKKELQLKKEIELIKSRQQKELQIFNKQIALRERKLKVKLEQEDLNERELENLVRAAILDQKKGIKSDSLNYIPEVRKKVEEKMKEEQEEARAQIVEIEKLKQKKRIEEEEYRRKIRQKIQKELRIEAIQKTKKQIETRELKEIREKQDHHSNFIKAENNHQKSIQEASQLAYNQQPIVARLNDKRSKQELAKSSLRQRFEQQLLSSYAPAMYLQPENNNSYILKNTENYLDDNYLYDKLDKNQQNQNKELQHSPLNKSSVKQHIYDLNEEQLHIYEKQKKKIQERQNKDAQKVVSQQGKNELIKSIPKRKKEDNGFQLMNIASKRENQKDSSDQEKNYKVRPVKMENQKKEKPQSNKIRQSAKQQKPNKKTKKDKKKAKKKSDTSESESEQKKQQQPKVVADSEDEQPSQKSQKRVVYYDAEDQKKEKKRRKQYKFPQMPQISVKKIKPRAQQPKFRLEVEALPEDQLDRYMESHFLRLPIEQTNIIPMDRQQLYRKLVNELTFCLILGQSHNRLMGMAYVYHDRNKSETRRLVLAHISTYNNQDLKQFILEVCDYLFRKDPCDEIQFVYQFNEKQEQQEEFSKSFNKWFDKYGHIYQKKIDDHIYQRKYVYKRPFNQECEVVLRGVNKTSFSNLFNVYSGVLMSDAGLSQVKDEIKIDSIAQDWISYGVMVAELFRNFMNPEDAEVLKQKVKEVAKLKQLLVLVVMLQKKKMRLEQLKLSSYKNIIELNMRLMSQGKEVIRYAKDSGVQFNELFYCQLSLGMNLPFGFQTTSLPTQVRQDEIRQISYFRLNPLSSHKLHLIKSSLYNSEMHLLPTQNSKTKLFVVNGAEYLELREKSKLDLFMYIRYFMKNVRSHSTSAWKYIWIPEMMDKGAWGITQFRHFFKKDLYVHDQVSLSYNQFLPNALIIQPQHRDLVITPPFIIGILSMGLQQVTEGSPIYARMIDADCLKTIEISSQR